MLAMIIENFGAGSAGSYIAHRPEIIFSANSGKTLGTDFDIFQPDGFGLRIFVENGHP